MSFSHITFEADGDGITVVAVNRPEKRNALNRAIMEELAEAFDRASREKATRGLIVTGTGKAFVAGADIAELAALGPAEARAYARRGQQVLRELETLGKPSVAAINGYALGGGLELAMACTVRFAAADAKLGLPEVKLGLVPGYGGTQRLPRLVGRGRAMEMLLSGEPVDAAEAHRIGLVNAVAPESELMRLSRDWLLKALANAPVALALAMEAVDVGLDSGLEDGMRFEAAAFGLAAATEDGREGTRAFLEKRPPAFAGK
ncbi:MAG TPA: enoyl-CoA hydratase-related protein [Bryobacteraceae bacterium]|nr:enoyl-CoA hydratase-related protein [Bryobacteraceae bacterium]